MESPAGKHRRGGTAVRLVASWVSSRRRMGMCVGVDAAGVGSSMAKVTTERLIADPPARRL